MKSNRFSALRRRPGTADAALRQIDVSRFLRCPRTSFLVISDFSSGAVISGEFGHADPKWEGLAEAVTPLRNEIATRGLPPVARFDFG